MARKGRKHPTVREAATSLARPDERKVIREMAKLGILGEPLPRGTPIPMQRFWSWGVRARRRSIHIDHVIPTPENVDQILVTHLREIA